MRPLDKMSKSFEGYSTVGSSQQVKDNKCQYLRALRQHKRS